MCGVHFPQEGEVICVGEGECGKGEGKYCLYGRDKEKFGSANV